VYDVGENNYDNNKKKHRRFGGRKKYANMNPEFAVLFS